MVINKSWIGEISLNRSLFFNIASVVDIQTLPQEEVDRYTSLLLRDLREVVQNLDHLMGGGTYIIQKLSPCKRRLCLHTDNYIHYPLQIIYLEKVD